MVRRTFFVALVAIAGVLGQQPVTAETAIISSGAVNATAYVSITSRLDEGPSSLVESVYTTEVSYSPSVSTSSATAIPAVFTTAAYASSSAAPNATTSFRGTPSTVMVVVPVSASATVETIAPTTLTDAHPQQELTTLQVTLIEVAGAVAIVLLAILAYFILNRRFKKARARCQLQHAGAPSVLRGDPVAVGIKEYRELDGSYSSYDVSETWMSTEGGEETPSHQSSTRRTSTGPPPMGEEWQKQRPSHPPGLGEPLLRLANPDPPINHRAEAMRRMSYEVSNSSTEGPPPSYHA